MCTVCICTARSLSELPEEHLPALGSCCRRRHGTDTWLCQVFASSLFPKHTPCTVPVACPQHTPGNCAHQRCAAACEQISLAQRHARKRGVDTTSHGKNPQRACRLSSTDLHCVLAQGRLLCLGLTFCLTRCHCLHFIACASTPRAPRTPPLQRRAHTAMSARAAVTAYWPLTSVTPFSDVPSPPTWSGSPVHFLS